MMNLSNFNLMKEDQKSYTVGHPSGKKLVVPKEGLSDKAHKVIKGMKRVQNFDEGGDVEGGFSGDNSSQGIAPPEQVAADIAAADAPDANTVSGVNPNYAGTQSSPADSAGPTPASAPDWQGSAGNASEDIAPAPAQTDSATPVAAPQDPYTQKAMNVSKGLQEEKNAQDAIAAAAGSQGKEESKDIGGVLDKIGGMKTQNDLVNEYRAKDQALEQAYANKTIDPHRYVNNLSTGSKISAGIGMALGGMGAGAGGANMAAQIFQNNINKDIEAQKMDSDKKMNLWRMNREALGTDLQANLATQNQMYTGLKFQLDQAAANAKGPQGQAQANLQKALIDQKIGENNFKLGLMDSRNGEIDPAQKVQFLVPQTEQPKVFEEIKNAQDTKNISPEILDAYDKASNETTAADFVPGVHSANQKRFMGLMNTTVKDIEGTARQAAMDSIENNMKPQFGDSAATKASKRQSIVEYLTSKSSAPMAKGYGINLNSYRSTAPVQQAPIIKNMNGIPYQKVPGGWAPVKK